MIKPPRTAECVSKGHPDKLMDRIADSIVDELVAQDRGYSQGPRGGCRVAIEGTIKENRLALKGEVTCRESDITGRITEIANQVWRDTYDTDDVLLVDVDIPKQSPDIAQMTDVGGAGDQGVMVGYATDETPEKLPLEFALSRRLLHRLEQCRRDGVLDWLKCDAKSQVTLDGSGIVRSVVLAVHHADQDKLKTRRGDNEWGMSDEAIHALRTYVIDPVVAEHCDEKAPPTITVNGCGIFTIGGSYGDAGEVGRKIVIDAYGPRVPVGGGAYSGKDPTKVDRSGAYMARHIARAAVGAGMARECLVHMAYAIGKHEPEMITCITETGDDLSEWARKNFRLAPWEIIQYLRLWEPNGWTYHNAAAFGHYGNDVFPWEKSPNELR